MRAFAIATSSLLALAAACGAPTDPVPKLGTFDEALTITGGVSRSGTGLVGAKLEAARFNGAALPLRIDGAAYGADANADLLFYAVSSRAGSAWTRLCGSEPDGSPTLAVALAGRWDRSAAGDFVNDPAALTLVCRHTALARSVESGYRP